MSGVLLRVADLAREPEFHLDELLEVLAQVPDGYLTERAEVWSGETKEPGWELEADSYEIGVDPNYRCGWSENGDGKVLTAITSRLQETSGLLVLVTAQVMQTPPPGPVHIKPYMQAVWNAAVTLGQGMPLGCACDLFENPRAGSQGLGQNDGPGVATLLAYLRAWGVLE
ncbi:hypothetical protein [Deinococcus humi]|uniref:Uncharacterized protein n=1 Tax=Deinococcus humi TaxID=662880 RepID=A0A7W8JTQ3_9DEIO|nr:hypothetical protein [Deinococcus humi]